MCPHVTINNTLFPLFIHLDIIIIIIINIIIVVVIVVVICAVNISIDNIVNISYLYINNRNTTREAKKARIS